MANTFTYGGQTILSHPIFVETILPFLLVFTIVFAVLQKSKILGDGKKQIDALVALVIGLVVISFAQATGIILQLIPFLAVSLVVVLVLLLLIGSFQKGALDMPKKLGYFFMTVAIIAVVIAVVYITGLWDVLYEMFFLGDSSGWLYNIGFALVIAAAIVVVLLSGGKGDGKDKKD